MTNKETLGEIEKWKENCLKFTENSEKFPFVIVGTKNDLNEDIEVEDHVAKQYCGKISYFSTSSKEKKGLDEAFKKMAELAYKRCKETKGT